MAIVNGKVDKRETASTGMSLTPRGSQYRVGTPNLVKVEKFPYVFRWSKPPGKSVSVSRVIATFIDPQDGEMDVNFSVDCRRESFSRVFHSLNDIVRSCDTVENQLISMNMSDVSHVTKACFDCTPPILLEGMNDSIEVSLVKPISMANEAYVMCEGWIYDCSETTVRDIMHSPLYASDGNSIYDVATLMSEKEVGSVLTLNEDGEVSGVLTERDVLKKVVGLGLDPRSTSVKQVASSPVVTIEWYTTIDEAAKLMVEKHIRRLPIMEDGSIIGIVSDRDLIRAIPAIFKRGF
jgi:CBS domain-containing protein